MGFETEDGLLLPFNPTLVRLRQLDLSEEPDAHAPFNPTLVRLRLRAIGPRKTECRLSIPRWFD